MEQQETRYLVLGGNGFVGSHIVQRLLSRGERHIAIYSRSKPPARKLVEGVEYYTGDITNKERLVEVMLESRARVVFHTVSPPHNDDEHMYYKVNVEGTQAVIHACEEAGVPVLIYTSSSGVVWSGQPISGAREDEIEIPEAIGEQAVLKANGEKLRTAALRPHAVVGPGDQQAIWRLVENYTSGQYHFQIGDGKNLFSTVSVRDVAEAHLLAASALLDRTRRDTVGGQAFFITDGVPIPFYHYPHLVWWELGAPRDFWRIALPRWFCFVLAVFAERWHGMVGGHTVLTRFIITTVTMEQWYSCEKAERLLGYKPSVTLEEAWWKKEGAQEHAAHRRNEETALPCPPRIH
ncbi:putative sterol dehydrogenase [Coprinellus micaceus]|uniref:Putative sterol dehydrogenase n=1 Tax=Coprinellus micaceus TaxID=71717 RepID=A0A4Y7SN09_COPMI|nr:putative sterol dehydrogenase [Coprinellus micaceus]